MSLLLMIAALPAQAATCLWVSSYAPGYEWEDGIGRGIRSKLADRCKLLEFHFDSKRHRSSQFAQRQAKRALAYIEQVKPDLIIASDDNVSKYLVAPYLKDGDLPVIFCGINWSVSEYGYPYKNATGMVEVAPVMPLLKEVKKVLDSPRRALYVASNVNSSRKDFSHFQRLFAEHGIRLESNFVDTMAGWLKGFRQGQKEYDFLIIGSNGGINDWSSKRVRQVVLRESRKFALAFHDWMAPFAMVTFNKIPEEQGEWAATLALEVLNGASPASIPISPNRRWQIFANSTLLQQGGYQLSPRTQRNAQLVKP